MKVQVVRLEPHDDQVSAREKLSWVKAPRVLIVWPEHAQILRRQLDLVLLLRQAERQRSQLAVVSQDPLVRDHAFLLGIPVFDGPDRIPESGWRRRDRRRGRASPLAWEPAPARGAPLPSVPRTLSLAPPLRAAFAAAAAISLAAVAAAIVPSAQIVLRPARLRQAAEVVLTLVAPSEAPLAGEVALSTQRLTSRIAGERRLPTTGEVLVATTYAEGEVVFVNLTAEAQSIPEGQTVRPAGRDDLFFHTLEDVRLGPARGSLAAASIRASAPGEIGNLAAGEIDAVDGPVGLTVSVSNPGPTTGGQSTPSPSPTAGDRLRLRRELEADLMAQAEAQWLRSLPQDTLLAPGTLGVSRVFREEYSAAAGEPAESHSLSLEVEVFGLSYLRQDLDASIGLVLDAALESGFAGVPGTLRMEMVRPSEIGSRTLRVRATRQVFAPLDRSALARDLAGQPIEKAQAILRGAGTYADPPLITVRPSWFPTLPWTPVRIEVLWDWETG